MRTPFICLAAVSFFLSVNAQTNSVSTAAKMPDPPYLNQVYFWQADSLLGLEQTTAQIKTKIGAMGFGGGGGAYVIEGGKSAIRISGGDNTRFAIKMNMMMGDPSMMIKLYRFDSKKTSRESRISGKSDTEITFNVQKSGSDIFILSPAGKLSPGEYGFMNMASMRGGGSRNMSYTFFAFGVD